MRYSIIFLLWIFTGSLSAASEPILTVSHMSPESANDKRQEYEIALLRLALEKTRPEYGAFELKPAPPMNFTRAVASLTQNIFPNLMIQVSYEKRYEDSLELDYIKFPIDLGMVGYRVCFVATTLKNKLARVETLDDLRQFLHGQGKGWADVQILRHNNFKVTEVNKYESLFKMTASERVDIFCRGTNELLDEYEGHKNIEGLTYDTTFSLTYPLPRFFYTHRSNTIAIDRVYKGIMMAYADGSLKKLWYQSFKSSIDFVRLDKRKIFHIENPLAKTVNFDFEQYIYKPEKDTLPN